MSEGTTPAQAKALFESTAPRYLGAEGLIRKYYLFDAAATVGGGCYLFRDRSAAEAMFDDQWRAFITGKYGAPPSLRFFETPVVVDNSASAIEVE
jgi:hypothetical protein